MKNRYFVTVFLPVLIGALALGGCPPKKKLPIEEKSAEEVPQETPTPTPEEANVGDVEIGQEWSEIPSLAVINFGYDSANLDDQNRSTLRSNVSVLKKLPSSVTVRVEGHCDERGTIEYNIALGQRRAAAVKNYYAAAGIAKNRIETISYGEERPLCTDQSEDCYARNRRAATKVRNPEKITIKQSSLQ